MHTGESGVQKGAVISQYYNTISFFSLKLTVYQNIHTIKENNYLV